MPGEWTNGPNCLKSKPWAWRMAAFGDLRDGKQYGCFRILIPMLLNHLKDPNRPFCKGGWGSSYVEIKVHKMEKLNWSEKKYA